MAENAKSSSKKDKKSKRQSLGDLKAATSTSADLTIEADASLLASTTKSLKKRKHHANTEDLVDLSTAGVVDHNAEETSTKPSKKAKKVEQQGNAVVEAVENKPEEGSAKSRKKEKKAAKRQEQSPMKADHKETMNPVPIVEADDPAAEAVAAGLVKGKKSRKVDGGGGKVEQKVDEIAVQPESIKQGKTKQPAAEGKTGESKSRKRKKVEEQVETVDEVTAQTKPIKSTKGKQPTEDAVVEGEPTPKKQRKAKDGAGTKINKAGEVGKVDTASTNTKQVALPSAEGNGAAEQKKKGKDVDTKEDNKKAVETSAHDLPTAGNIKKPKPHDPATQTTPMPPKSKSISAPRKSTTSGQADEPTKKSKTPKTKDPSPSPEPTPSDDDNVDGDVRFDSAEDDELHLHGFSTDEDDSSDEELAMDFEAAPLDVAKLPTVAKDDATVKRKLDKAKRQPAEERGVLFIGRLPHGFYEDQLKAYFSQFGTVTRLRVSRNKKTGRSKHYAFLEFDSLAVAQIVADTMDNYLLMGHILRCKLIPKDEVHPELWIGANRTWRPVPRDRLTRLEHNKPRTLDEQARAAKRLIKRQNARKRKLAEAGIGYNFDAVGYRKPKEAQP